MRMTAHALLIGTRTFSSSSFFSVKFLRLRAVSSRRSAISDSVSCFFLREDSAAKWMLACGWGTLYVEGLTEGDVG